MDNDESKKENSTGSDVDRKEQKHGRRKSLGFREAADIAMMVKRWRSVSNARRKIPQHRMEHRHPEDRGASPDDPCCSILAEDEVPQGTKPPRLFGRDVKDLSEPGDLNRCLLRYFIKVSDHHSDLHSDQLDVDFIVDLLSRGADLNTRDKHGQTILHEVARNWSTGVMELMASSGGKVNAADYLGWTPLHVAASYDYPEMCRTLVRLGADKEARVANQQTPLFFAAKTDSARSLRALIKLGCDFTARDSRGRTPLFAASELDRSATAAVLLANNADAFVQDHTGQIAFVPLIEKMPPLAAEALRPLHKTFRIEREQRMELFRLDPMEVCTETKAGQDASSAPETVKRVPYYSAMKAIINTNNYQVIGLPIIRAMISEQWKCYGRSRAIGQVILQLVNIILWTVFAVAKEWTQRFQYELPQDIYRIVVLIGACVITTYLIAEEIMEFVRARLRHKAWQKWRLDLIAKDIQHVHRCHTDEGKYLSKEAKDVEDSSASYLDDWWNYLDWTCYIILVASVSSHFADVWWVGGEGNLMAARWHVRIMALNILMLWIRLLKYVKPFEFFGPFIVMLGMILGDLLKFFLLYLEFFIPFACIFWTILGGTNNMKEADVVVSGTFKNYTNYNLTRANVQYFDALNNALFSMFRLTLVDAYDYTNMAAIDQVTAQVLLGAWFSISAILFLNLFIAQLSETFKSVFDNAKAAATMQKAITLQGCYDTMRMGARVRYHKFLKKHCNPLSMPYDDDVTQNNPAEEQQKATIHIRAIVDEMHSKLTRLYTREVLHSDSEDEAVDVAVEERGVRSKRRTKSRHLAEKAAVSVRSRLESLEKSTRTELVSIKLMLQDIAIVVTGLTRDHTVDDAASRGGSPDSVGASSALAAGGGQTVATVARQSGGITEVEPMAPQFRRNNI